MGKGVTMPAPAGKGKGPAPKGGKLTTGKASAATSEMKLLHVKQLAKQLLEEAAKCGGEAAYDAVAEAIAKSGAGAETLARMAEALSTAAAGLEQKPEEGEGPPAAAAAESSEVPEIDSSRYAEAAELFFQEEAERSEWPNIWSGLGPPEEENDAIVAILEAGSAEPELRSTQAAEIVAELARLGHIKMVSVEQSMMHLAKNLEAMVGQNESAWHTHSHVLTALFPKTPSSTWGWEMSSWDWAQWWRVAQRVLALADRFRAFDILVLSLQTMQERSEVVVKSQGVWKVGTRLADLRTVLSTWGEMDGASILETLGAYGVEI